MISTKERLKKIKSGAFSRGMALAKVSVSAGARAASHAVSGIFAQESEKEGRLKAMVLDQVQMLTRELGQLKGSVMKVGQMLSMHGEHLLPPEANAVLKSLQSQSPPLEWAAIARVLERELGKERLSRLEVDPEPLAAASLGQVHRARLDGRELVLKVQYPGVDEAIEGDIKTLKYVLSVSKLLPRGPRYDGLFEEVRSMLHQETDYAQELQATSRFRELLSDDPRYLLPEPVPEYSTPRVLALTYEEGLAIDDPQVLALSQERRDRIGTAALELYFREAFRFNWVQTDPHFGNYRIRLGRNGAPDQLILFDFGAARKLPEKFVEPYKRMIRAAILQDVPGLERGAIDVGFMREEDSREIRDSFARICWLFVEPFFLPGDPLVPQRLVDAEGRYSWGESDLPKRVIKQGSEVALLMRLRPPPPEVVFLDRKMGGIFVFLRVLGVRIRTREMLLSYL